MRIGHRRGGEGYHAVVSQTELRFLLAEEEEREIEGCRRGGKHIVAVDIHLRALSVEVEGGVGRVVGNNVDIVAAVEVLHGNVRHAAEFKLVVDAVDDGVPAFVVGVGAPRMFPVAVL